MKEFASITVENSDGIPKMRREMGESFEVGVLISGGFGAGWSTWTPECSSVLLFHKDIVEFIVNNPPQTCVDAEIWNKKLETLVHGWPGCGALTALIGELRIDRRQFMCK